MSQALKQYYSQIRQKLGLLEQRADELNRAAEMMAPAFWRSAISSSLAPATPVFWRRR